MSSYDDELERLEGRPVHEPEWRAGMWRRSYDIALYANGVLEDRVILLRQQHWDTPMTFFYPEPEDTPLLGS